MPTRKQRRRREKDFRHDVRVYEIDEEGNEVPIAELRTRDEKPSGTPTKQSKGTTQKGGSRQGREVPPPTWHRALRRGGMMGGLMFLAFVFLFKSSPLGLRLAWGLFYAVAFIPLTYWIDRTAYRSYQKRQARQQAGAQAKPKKS
jgi:hypothetical protein